MKRVSASIVFALLCGAQPSLAQEDDRPDPKEEHIAASIAAEEQIIAAGVNRFGFDLYRQLRNSTGDVVVSPASVSTAFGLAYAGAKGQTASQIASTLHYPSNTSDFHGSFGRLLHTMRFAQNGRTLAVNNAIWLQNEMGVHKAYLALIDTHYQAGIQRVDFKADPEAARGKINRWVEANTNDRIRDLLSSLEVTKLTPSVLVNTIYFKADWAAPFDADATKGGKFTPRSGPQVSLPMMNQHGRFRFAEADGIKALAMPYRGGETEMVILLPKDSKSLAVLEKSSDASMLDRWLKRLSETGVEEVIVTLPRFKIEARYNLSDALKSLGMTVPLSESSDFSGMKLVNPASSNVEDWNLKIDTVIHQVFVEVKEKGTEAAAATATSAIVVTGKKANTKPPKVFRADHPFLFVIRDQRTKMILFVGRFTGEGC